MAGCVGLVPGTLRVLNFTLHVGREENVRESESPGPAPPRTKPRPVCPESQSSSALGRGCLLTARNALAASNGGWSSAGLS